MVLVTQLDPEILKPSFFVASAERGKKKKKGASRFGEKTGGSDGLSGRFGWRQVSHSRKTAAALPSCPERRPIILGNLGLRREGPHWLPRPLSEKAERRNTGKIGHGISRRAIIRILNSASGSEGSIHQPDGKLRWGAGGWEPGDQSISYGGHGWIGWQEGGAWPGYCRQASGEGKDSSSFVWQRYLPMVTVEQSTSLRAAQEI